MTGSTGVLLPVTRLCNADIIEHQDSTHKNSFALVNEDIENLIVILSTLPLLNNLLFKKLYLLFLLRVSSAQNYHSTHWRTVTASFFCSQPTPSSGHLAFFEAHEPHKHQSNACWGHWHHEGHWGHREESDLPCPWATSDLTHRDGPQVAVILRNGTNH